MVFASGKKNLTPYCLYNHLVCSEVKVTSLVPVEPGLLNLSRSDFPNLLVIGFPKTSGNGIPTHGSNSWTDLTMVLMGSLKQLLPQDNSDCL